MGREDREGPPPVQVGEGGSLVPTSHSKVVATTHPGHSHVPQVHLLYMYMRVGTRWVITSTAVP